MLFESGVFSHQFVNGSSRSGEFFFVEVLCLDLAWGYLEKVGFISTIIPNGSLGRVKERASVRTKVSEFGYFCASTKLLMFPIIDFHYAHDKF